MKAVILAGGFGTRLSEETTIKPKPMVEIGGQPILWHIMKSYFEYGIKDFIICLGYKGYAIKEYFASYALQKSDVTIDLKTNEMDVHKNGTEPWRVTMVDTGEKTQTGGRLKRVEKYLGSETFCLTYGDGVSDVNIDALVGSHLKNEALVTLTAVQPPGRFGAFNLSGNENRIATFKEKPHGDGAWINGGFFVLDPEALNYIEGDSTVWEQEPLEHLAQEGKLSAYRHSGFWQPMDTLRDRMLLEELWSGENMAPWKIWND